MTFAQFAKLWPKTRDPFAGKPLENNTRLFKRADDCFAVRFHDTDVVTVFKDDSIILSSNGWYSMSTKDRIGSYAPVQIQSDRGVWYVVHEEARKRADRKARKEFGVPMGMRYAQSYFFGGDDHYLRDGTPKHGTPEYKAARKLSRAFHDRHMELCRVPFFDGIRFTKAGRCTNGVTPAEWTAHLKARTKMTKRIKNYCAGFDRALAKSMPMPSGGDCWGCCMHAQDGSEVMGNHHLLLHLEESYYVPSLAVNALRAKGYQDTGISVHLHVNPDDTMGGVRYRSDGLVRRALRDYLCDRLLPAPDHLHEH